MNSKAFLLQLCPTHICLLSTSIIHCVLPLFIQSFINQLVAYWKEMRV